MLPLGLLKHIIYILYFSIIFNSLIINGQKITVCPECPHSDLREAIQSASNFDTILIAGDYSLHDLIIDKPITIIGKNYPTINGDHQGTIIKIVSDSVVISGLHIIGVGQSYTKDFAAIQISNVNGFLISNNKISDAFFGILIEKSKRGEISNNQIYGVRKEENDSGNGVHAWHSSELSIHHNTVYHMRDGIYFEFVKNSEIYQNYSHDNIRYGLHFMFSNHDIYHDNTFERNGAGVAVMFSKFITMEKNHFENNWGASSYGLLLKEIYDGEIHHNQFIKNTIAINLEGSTRINYSDNNFINNGWAIKVTGACYKNIFRNNNFVGNSFDMSYNGQLNDNKFEQNYWSEYTGYDLDKDGFGDVPFRPVKLFSYVVNKTPETIVMMRSLFVDILNFSEKVSPVFTPDKLIDPKPLMKMRP